MGSELLASKVVLGEEAPKQRSVPILPTAHYAMGGIPTDVTGRVVMDAKNTPVLGQTVKGMVLATVVAGNVVFEAQT